MLSKISLGINILLIAAVAFLFYKTSSGTKSKSSDGTVPATATAFSDTSDIKIPVTAFVNGDSIMAKYTYFIEMREQLERSMNKSQSKIEADMKKAQAEYEELMNYANSKGTSLPPDEQQTISDRIMELEYMIKDTQAREERMLMEEEAKLNKQLMKRITSYVDEYAKEKNIDVVLNYQEGMQVILYGSPAFDITSEVIGGLNESYEKEKSEKK